MGFLKKVTAAAIAVLMVIFLNNLMAKVFPHAADEPSYEKAYEACRQYQVEYGTPVKEGEAAPIIKGNTEQYDTCYKEHTESIQDRQAINYQQGLIRAFIVMLLAVGVAAFLFRRYPYLSGGLIAGGVLFLIIYPLMNMSGFGGWGFSTDASSAVQQQLQLTKLIMAAVGFFGLVAADLFFFEKEPKAPTKTA
jgi:hypothetical protein